MKHMLSRTALTMAVLSALGTASVGAVDAGPTIPEVKNAVAVVKAPALIRLIIYQRLVMRMTIVWLKSPSLKMVQVLDRFIALVMCMYLVHLLKRR